MGEPAGPVPAGGAPAQSGPGPAPASCLRERPAKTCASQGGRPLEGTPGPKGGGGAGCAHADADKLPREQGTNCESQAAGAWLLGRPPAGSRLPSPLREGSQAPPATWRGCAVSRTAPPALLLLEPTVELGLTPHPSQHPTTSRYRGSCCERGPRSCCPQGPAFFLKYKLMTRQELMWLSRYLCLCLSIGIFRAMFLGTLGHRDLSRWCPKKGIPGVVSLEKSGLNRSQGCLCDRNSQVLYSAV